MRIGGTNGTLVAGDDGAGKVHGTRGKARQKMPARSQGRGRRYCAEMRAPFVHPPGVTAQAPPSHHTHSAFDLDMWIRIRPRHSTLDPAARILPSAAATLRRAIRSSSMLHYVDTTRGCKQPVSGSGRDMYVIILSAPEPSDCLQQCRPQPRRRRPSVARLLRGWRLTLGPWVAPQPRAGSKQRPWI